MVSKEMSKKDYAVLTRARRFIESAAERLSFSGSPTQLTKEAAYRRVRCKRSFSFYRDNRSQQLHRVTLPAQKFIHRFLLHTLPRGCAKVRYYGICSPACRAQLEQARALLGPARIAATTPAAVDAVLNSPLTKPAAPLPASARCPHCQFGQLFEVRVLPPQRKVPP